MPLSDHEQRLLEQLEKQLSSDDPRFASAMRGSRSRGSTARRWVIGGIAVVLGLLLLLVGVSQDNLALGVAAGVGGFLVMLGGTVFALSAPARRGPTGVVGANGATTARPAPAKRNGRHTAFMQRLEQRWDQRRDRGFGG